MTSSRRTPSRRAVLAGLAAAATVPLPARADAGWEALARPGTVAIMRHALAPGTGDPPGFRLGDCSTQRNLDARGRAQARATGDAIRAAGIAFDRVLTSQWCRCRETAELLGLGPVEEFPALNSFFDNRSGRQAQTRAVLDFLNGLPPDRRVMLVTHQVNIAALTRRGVASGEVFVLAPRRGGPPEVVAELLIAP